MTSKFVLTSDDLLSFAKLLHQHHHGRMQFRDGYKEALNGFCVVRAPDPDQIRFEGHLCGPHGNNATFSVWVGGAGNPLIHLKPEAPFGFNFEKAYVEVTKSFEVMMERAGKPVGRISTKYWDGYYLRSTGAKKVGATGDRNFDEAIDLSLVSLIFKQTCLDYGFSMLKCGAKEPAPATE